MKRIYSIIIPAYNSERNILKLLQSLRVLEMPPAEIILINDASKDSTYNLVKREKGIKLITLKENLGPSGARNKGAEIAKSNWLLFIDSDCSIPQGSIKYAFPNKEEEENNIVGIMGVFSPKFKNESKISNYKNIQRYFEISSMSNPPDIFSSSCFTISKEAFFKSGGFKETFGKIPTEDNEFYFRLIKNNFRIKYNISFSFLHHKKMSIKTLFLDDFSRAKAIILNLFGYLGERRSNFKKVEIISWTLEILFSLVFQTNLILFGISLLIIPFSTITFLSIFLFSALILIVINYKFLKFSFKIGGIRILLMHFLLRNFEILTAIIGIAFSLLEIVFKWIKKLKVYDF